MGGGQASIILGHQDGHNGGQVATLAHGMTAIGGRHPAAGLGPGPAHKVPPDAGSSSSVASRH